MPKVCIIGAGITGLAHAWQLHNKGTEVTVLESSDHVGGAIRTVQKDGYLTEEGPNSIQLHSPELEAFFRTVPGLNEQMVEAKPEAKKRFIVRKGKLRAVPMGPLSAVTSPLFSLKSKLRILKEPFIKPSPSDTEESVADFIRRRLGPEVYEYAFNPLIGGIYAGNPEELSLRHAFPKLHQMEQSNGGLIRGAIAKMRGAKHSNRPKFRKRIISFRNGIHTLPQYIAKALDQQITQNATIQSVEQSEGHWQVTWNNGASKTESFDQLIVTVPAHTLTELPFKDTLQNQFKPLQEIQYPPVSVLSLGFKREQIGHPIDGFGALVPECEERTILGVLFPDSVFQNRAPEGHVLLTVFIGGTRNPELATADTETLKETILPDLNALLKIKGAPCYAHHKHWPRAIPQYNIGYDRVLNTIENIENEYDGLKLLGNYRTGISLINCIESSYQTNG